MQLVPATNAHHYAVAADLFREYLAWLGEDLFFQHVDEELSQPHKMYGPTDGGIILMQEAGKWIGCAAIRRHDAETAELKRMYIQEAYRGHGYSHTLMKACLELCESLGYKRVVLDTLGRLRAAITLYKQYGFTETTAYYDNPLPGVVYMEKNLASTS